MARAEKRRSEKAQLQHEINELRSAARQLLQGLTEYGKTENWSKVVKEEPGSKPDIVWIGEGDGPTIARKYLGLDQEQN